VDVSENKNFKQIYLLAKVWIIIIDDLTITLDGINVQGFVNKVNAMWREAFPLTPFNYTFVDDLITSQYVEEDRQSAVILFFTGLAILVVFLGLFGLTSFVIVQRTKEVGIRKVLGAEIVES
jgi:putative ABC transport system permease protein